MPSFCVYAFFTFPLPDPGTSLSCVCLRSYISTETGIDSKHTNGSIDTLFLTLAMCKLKKKITLISLNM